ncbi:hypothetical protein [Malonomonas rubra]|uniref:hypothetical protein n=1 Tax=Malonomonas rubra TaxID=57040 RepID=UPI0026F2872D|nr:hypothetical protein [Malonomonas rubra]
MNGLAQPGVTPLLRLPALQVQPGEELILKIYFHNEAAERFRGKLPESLSLRFKDAEHSASLVTAVALTGSVTGDIPPGGFVTKDYHLELPIRFQGMVEVLLVENPGSFTLLNFMASALPTEQVASAEVTADQDFYPSMESLFSLYQPYVVNISAYELCII